MYYDITVILLNVLWQYNHPVRAWCTALWEITCTFPRKVRCCTIRCALSVFPAPLSPLMMMHWNAKPCQLITSTYNNVNEQTYSQFPTRKKRNRLSRSSVLSHLKKRHKVIHLSIPGPCRRSPCPGMLRQQWQKYEEDLSSASPHGTTSRTGKTQMNRDYFGCLPHSETASYSFCRSKSHWGGEG